MADPKTGRAVSQDDWKRTQVRMPQEQYEELMSYAEKNNLSLNTAMLELMDLGLKSKVEGKSGRSIYFNDLVVLKITRKNLCTSVLHVLRK